MTISYIQPDMFGDNLAQWPFGDLEPQAYGAIMADPPWHFETYSDAGIAKGAQAQYQTMTVEDIAALPVADLGRTDCMLWLWACWPTLVDAMWVMKEWGFQYVTGGAWNKKRWGTGYVLRSQCEPFLIGKRGSPKIDGRSVSNLIEESRREHSRKPEAAYLAVERMMPRARKVEVFSRTNREGWDAWGDEVGKFGEAA